MPTIIKQQQQQNHNHEKKEKDKNGDRINYLEASISSYSFT